MWQRANSGEVRRDAAAALRFTRGPANKHGILIQLFRLSADAKSQLSPCCERALRLIGSHWIVGGRKVGSDADDKLLINLQEIKETLI